MQSVYVASFSEAAEELGVRYQTVGELVRKLGIEPKPIRHCRRAKGLTEEDVAVLRERLRPIGVAAV